MELVYAIICVRILVSQYFEVSSSHQYQEKSRISILLINEHQQGLEPVVTFSHSTIITAWSWPSEIELIDCLNPYRDNDIIEIKSYVCRQDPNQTMICKEILGQI